jgi:hypothetical protein
MSNHDFLKGECRHCAGHLEFPADAIGQTVPCPHCGQLTELALAGTPGKTKGARRVWLGISIAVCLAAAGLAATWVWKQRTANSRISSITPVPAALSTTPVVSTTAPVVSPPPQVQVLTNDFAILPFKLEKTPGSSLVYVTGTVRNSSDRQRFGVKVEFGLMDTNDRVIGSATDYQSVLDPRANWRFRAMVMESKTASARFNSIIEEK